MRGGVKTWPVARPDTNDARALPLKRCLMRQSHATKPAAANALRACTATQVHTIVTLPSDRLPEKLTYHPVKTHLFHIVTSSMHANIGTPGAVQAVCIIHLNIYASNSTKSATINSICGIAQRQRTGIGLRAYEHSSTKRSTTRSPHETQRCPIESVCDAVDQPCLPDGPLPFRRS
ncbi:hypothetical protein BCEP4_320175 [Burkholderia cepacia]|nr:hypothetical protein BCEP4_320175 [Burkholderia cepacia]